MLATVDCQLPKPRGLNTKATAPPMAASKEALLSSTMPKPASVKPKPWRNHRITEESRITVPARLMKIQPRSQVARSTLPAVGA